MEEIEAVMVAVNVLMDIKAFRAAVVEEVTWVAEERDEVNQLVMQAWVRGFTGRRCEMCGCGKGCTSHPSLLILNLPGDP